MSTSILPDDPRTVEDLVRLCDRFPEHAHRWRPAPENAALMGLHPARLRAPQPFPEGYRRREILTIVRDPEFRAALAKLIGGAR